MERFVDAAEVTAGGQTDAGLHTCYGDKIISF